MNKPELPSEVFVDPTEKLVYVTPEVEAAFPDPVDAYETIDARYAAHTRRHFKRLEKGLFTFKSSIGAPIDCSLIPGKGNGLLVVWAPFSDGSPNSSSEDIYHYVKREETSKIKAAPNSWSQTTKSSVISELLKTIDQEMPVLTIFNPMPSFPHNAYTHHEYKKIRWGNFTPAAHIALEAIYHVQDRLHGKKSETQLEELHVHGASLGASTAIGAAIGLLQASRYAVRSVTAQELIIAPRNVVPDLALRFTVKGTVGEPSDAEVDEDLPVILEPLMRQEVDSHGNEPMMFGRMLLGMSKLSRLKGLTRPHRNQTPSLIDKLVATGVDVCIPLAENSGLTHDTPDYLPGSGEHIIKVRAVEGQRTAHLIDEHVALTSLLAVMNIRRSRR